VAEAAGAADALAGHPVDCVVVGPRAGDLAAGLAGLVTPSAAVDSRMPVIVYADGQPDGAAEGAAAAEAATARLGDGCTVHTVRSPDALLDLATFYLHRPIAKLSDDQRRELLERDLSDRPLAGRKVLIVDDDMRNIFALSTVLEEHEMAIVSADNGRDAIRLLQKEADVEIVLMDIMMPEMDGMETMREIRKVPQLKNLPIVAVTAKAMKGDREKCIEAGAWDYLSKPVDPEQLLAVLRAWLHR
jgi:CheY-like chemotaxis protein